MIKRLSFLIGIFLFGFFSAQKKEQLQKQNADLKKQISSINSNLAKTQQQSKLSLAYLNEVEKKIGLREKVYTNTQKEKKLVEDEIYLRQLEINRQNRELAVLRKNYAEVLVKAYKNKGSQNKVTFILSSKNLGEALRRIQYLKDYSDYQDKKAAEISNAAKVLQQNITLKQKSVKDKEMILSNQQKELLTIEAEKKTKQALLEEFKKNETQLTAELKQKQAESKKLEGQIRSIIAEEIRIAKAKEEENRKIEAEKIRLAKIAAEREKARIDAENKARMEALALEKKKADDEARRLKEISEKKAADEAEKAKLAAAADAKKTEDSKKAADAERAEARRLAAAKDAAAAAANAKAAADKAADVRVAEANMVKKNDEEKKAAEKKAMTNYGVSANVGNNFAANRGKMGMPVYGTITHRFGRQPHPVFKNIVEENNGVKIAVTKGTVAKCIAPGTVSRVMASGDGSKTVIVKHGDYFTIYANLSSTMVSANQQVSAGTSVGVVGEDFDGSYTLDFQIWNGSNPVDPLGWVN
ncbi:MULTISPECIES: murein hydrolase activator EnvC [unclassified Kaistella]|uniref:murein hydrolase activator EnvC family protein n=1 Tax=unclassified Kaistella TaxID=2762626 RepID=UPI0027364F7A|nr:MULTISPECIES: peptidoglycan DD-metalloendopeptidase family protein [unclassified Kaistella]MDP2452694.1 peptidoglycan DD-metalloendopeptidase family protein [Kaistella sp. SH11-4b]MDP2455603.1 peptidoglycan DD-metalloendopeptidase family protein [Kaistella sp. SH40-3]MDP2458507.1 peptidoglycan DD-metalloendopeptidase family protein [Kaistella sp. SH19-2b]